MNAAELIRRCLAGDTEACFQFHFIYYLLPRLERIIEETTKERNFILPIRPEPRPTDLISNFINQQKLIEVAFGEPHTEPNLPIKLKLKSTIGFRNTMMMYNKKLDKRIKLLEKECKILENSVKKQ